jgi:hypothetical protein
MAARSLTVNFRAQGERNVQQAGKRAEKALDDVGKAAEEAGEGAGGATDSIRSLSETLGGELGPAAGEVLGTFDKISGVIGQVGNAAKVLSGVAIVELILQFKSFYETMTVNEKALERQKMGVEAVTAAYETLASKIGEAEKEAKLLAFSTSTQFAVGVAEAEAKMTDANRRLQENLDKRLKATEALQRAQLVAERASQSGFADIAAQNRAEAKRAAAEIKQLERDRKSAMNDFYNAQLDRQVIIDDAARADAEARAAQRKALGLEEKDRKGVAKAVNDQATAYDRMRQAFFFQLAVGQDALRDALVELAEGAEATETAAAVFDAVRAGQQLVVDGYTAIGAAAEQVGAVQEYIHRQNMQMIAAEVEADAARAQALLGSAAHLAEELGLSTRFVATLKAADAFADAATETARAIASAASWDVVGALQHSLSAAAFGVAAAKHLSTAAGGGGGGGGGGGAGAGAALSAPRPPSDSDIAGGGARGGGRGDSVINVTFAGDVYDTREAADRALASRAIRGTNSLSRTAGTPRVRAAAIRQR